MRAHATLLLVLLTSVAKANDYLWVDFSAGLPTTFALENADGMELRGDIYKNIDLQKAWQACRLPDHGYTAFSPTRSTDASRPEENRLTLPAVTIGSADAHVVWEARSVHHQIAETYRVEAKVAGTDTWVTLCEAEADRGQWQLHHASLADFAGHDVQVAFVATTCNGFALAIDNIEVGIPTKARFALDNRTSHYICADESAHVCGRLTNFGTTTVWDHLVVEVEGSEVARKAVPPLAIGQSLTIDLPIPVATGRTDYELIATTPDGTRETLATDFVVAGAAKRVMLIDRCTGTWCNNCPLEAIEVARLEQQFGDEVLIVEQHINDAFMLADYYYTKEFVFDIPKLVVNHLPSSIKTDGFTAAMSQPAEVGISARATLNDDGSYQAVCHLEGTTDGVVRYLLLADLHTDALESTYVQRNAPSSYSWEEYYYQPGAILPEMSTYRNVPVAVVEATDGAATVQRPADLPADTPLTLVAIVQHPTTGEVLNCCRVTCHDEDGISPIRATQPAHYYDLQGRRIQHPQRGLYIHNGKIFRQS
ncbi:MAG: thioredoxin family protein [Bacteroidaceae bacterium]|nr:thioredoxin family protein [Bacteroidaceae bacterium]